MVRGRVTRVDCELRKLTVVSFPEVHISAEYEYLCTPAITIRGVAMVGQGSLEG